MGQPATLDQTLRFCGANEVLCEISYNGVVRLAEVYSYRTSKTGVPLLYIYCYKDNKIESLKLDQIEYAKATKQKFSPRYPIELK